MRRARALAARVDKIAAGELTQDAWRIVCRLRDGVDVRAEQHEPAAGEDALATLRVMLDVLLRRVAPPDAGTDYAARTATLRAAVGEDVWPVTWCQDSIDFSRRVAGEVLRRDAPDVPAVAE